MDERLKDWMLKTPEERLNEPGTEPPCPYCQRPRVKRSDYIRCNPCGKNWNNDQDIYRNPNLNTRDISRLEQANSTGAQPAKSTSDADRA